MPNWCYNRVEVYSENTADIQEISEIFTTDSPFNTLVPRPEDQEDNWYEWNCANWGVKWDISDVDLSSEEGSLEMSFDTAWGPPDEICQALRERYPEADVTWFYDEPGCQIAGYL
jgi:hypothetical protein